MDVSPSRVCSDVVHVHLRTVATHAEQYTVSLNLQFMQHDRRTDLVVLRAVGASPM